jgi:hypothetical protein
VSTNLIDYRKLPSVSANDARLFPRCTGVYFAISDEERLLYIGKALHIRNRWRHHHNANKLAKLGFNKLHYSELEAAYINEYQPPLNKTRKDGKAYSTHKGEGIERKQNNITVGDRVQSDYRDLARFMGMSYATLLRSILETHWANPDTQALIRRAQNERNLPN